MEDFNTSLVREKIVMTADGDSPDKAPVVIRSNRIFLLLGEGAGAEKVVVRAQNMHTTLRIAAKVLGSFYADGPLSPRSASLNWEEQWRESLSSYEHEFNPKNWCAIYINGKSVFKTMTSPFVDVIEKCALLTLDNYDSTMGVTETALKKVGHAMRISHASSVAATFSDNGASMRCGIIHRTDKKDTAFSFTASKGQPETRIVQSFGAAAAYLEAFNLRFMIHLLRDKIRMGEAKKVSPENSQIRAAIVRQGAINRAIHSFEDMYDVKYRPDKPDFFSDAS
jgi:hypothetical protein